MTVDALQLEDSPDKVYLFGVDALREDEVSLWEEEMESVFDHAETIIIPGGLHSVDKTVFYAELSAREWKNIVERNQK